MGWRSSTLGLAALLLVLLVGLAAGTGAVWGAFSAPTVSAGNEVRSAPDFVAPLTSAATVQKATGGTPGFVRSGSSYRIFAAVTDSGKPSSGIAQVSTGTNGGATGTALTAGTYPAVGGVTYTHRSAQQTFGTVSAGTYGFAMGATDGAGNGRTQTGFSYTVDNTAPAAAAVSTGNHTGGIVGRPEAGDTLTLTYSEPIDPISLVTAWEGQAPTNVVVRLTDGGFFSNDSATIYNGGNTAALPTGTVDLGRTDYVSTSRTFGASGTNSALSVSGNDVTVTLGTGSGTTTTTSFTGSLRWTPGSGSTDRAGNPLTSTAVVAESGTADKDF
jgi:hypothetical protein